MAQLWNFPWHKIWGGNPQKLNLSTHTVSIGLIYKATYLNHKNSIEIRLSLAKAYPSLAWLGYNIVIYQYRNIVIFNITILQYYNFKILQHYNNTILKYYNNTILQYYYITLLKYYNNTILQYYKIKYYIKAILK